MQVHSSALQDAEISMCCGNYLCDDQVLLTRFFCDSRSISMVCICLCRAFTSVWAQFRASVFCVTCVCTSMIYGNDGIVIYIDFLMCAGKHCTWWQISFYCYLRLMPSFEFFLVLLCHLLILRPYVCHNLSKVLSFTSINIYMNSGFGNLVAEFQNILQRKRVDCRWKICYVIGQIKLMVFLSEFPKPSTSSFSEKV